MAGKLRLVIVTPEGKTFDDDVEQVVMPGVEGQLGVLPGHVPLLTQIMPGELDLKAHSKGDELAVGGGFAEITGSRVTILTDMAVKPEDIDEHAVELRVDALRQEERLEEHRHRALEGDTLRLREALRHRGDEALAVALEELDGDRLLAREVLVQRSH